MTTVASNPQVQSAVVSTVAHITDGSAWKLYDYLVDHLAEKIATHLFELERNEERTGE